MVSVPSKRQASEHSKIDNNIFTCAREKKTGHQKRIVVASLANGCRAQWKSDSFVRLLDECSNGENLIAKIRSISTFNRNTSVITLIQPFALCSFSRFQSRFPFFFFASLGVGKCSLISLNSSFAGASMSLLPSMASAFLNKWKAKLWHWQTQSIPDQTNDKDKTENEWNSCQSSRRLQMRITHENRKTMEASETKDTTDN